MPMPLRCLWAPSVFFCPSTRRVSSFCCEKGTGTSILTCRAHSIFPVPYKWLLVSRWAPTPLSGGLLGGRFPVPTSPPVPLLSAPHHIELRVLALSKGARAPRSSLDGITFVRGPGTDPFTHYCSLAPVAERPTLPASATRRQRSCRASWRARRIPLFISSNVHSWSFLCGRVELPQSLRASCSGFRD
jgi:hypothetical protein